MLSGADYGDQREEPAQVPADLAAPVGGTATVGAKSVEGEKEVPPIVEVATLEPDAPLRPFFARNLPQLESFYEALDALRTGEREAPVRILWLGDSHTAADFLTHPLREHLSRQVQDGGPGFVRLGLAGYRHGAVSFEIQGKVRKAPLLPAQRTRVLDGVFGYGGIRTLPASGSRITATLKDQSDDRVTWVLTYRLAPNDKLDVELGNVKERLVFDPDAAEEGEISRRAFSGRAKDSFVISHAGGDPQVFGAFVERDEPGVVLDTVGINGARLATTLAWSPQQYQKELQLRDPDLLVLAFGTNEIFDRTNVDRYEDQFVEVLHLAREVLPELPCWVVGPPDAATSEGNSRTRVSLVTDVQRRAALAMGCAFSSQFELMGGEGSFSRWMSEHPAKARSDHIHFTIAGYRTLGEALAEELLPQTAQLNHSDNDSGAANSLPKPSSSSEQAGESSSGPVQNSNSSLETSR